MSKIIVVKRQVLEYRYEFDSESIAGRTLATKRYVARVVAEDQGEASADITIARESWSTKVEA